MMEEFDAIIIGAGVAGLFCAFKLSREGKRVLLIERQPLPGGYATTFSRKGFTFESSLHCVGGLGKKGEVRKFLTEQGILQDGDFIELHDFARNIYPEHDFIVDFNKEHLIASLKRLFPAQEKDIDSFFRALDVFYKQFDAFCEKRFPAFLNPLIVPFMYPQVIKANNCTLDKFIEPYIKDPKLKALITNLWKYAGLPPSRVSALYFLLIFEEYYYESTAYVRGGFMKLFTRMVERMRESGSQVRFNTSVERIVTQDGKAVRSVITDTKEEFGARVIISNANAIDTLTVLLDNEKLKERYYKKVSSLEKSISAFQVYLGLDVPLKALGMDCAILSVSTSYSPDEEFACCESGDYEHCSFEITAHSQIDPSLVPPGKGSLLLITFDTYAHWKGLKGQAYKAKKAEVAQTLIRRAEQYLPGLSKHIEVMEAATPKTMQRYTLSPEGALYGFAQTVGQSGTNRLAQETHCKGLLLTGAWTLPGGGFFGCFISGIEAADLALQYLRC